MPDNSHITIIELPVSRLMGMPAFLLWLVCETLWVAVIWNLLLAGGWGGLPFFGLIGLAGFVVILLVIWNKFPSIDHIWARIFLNPGTRTMMYSTMLLGFGSEYDVPQRLLGGMKKFDSPKLWEDVLWRIFGIDVIQSSIIGDRSERRAFRGRGATFPTNPDFPYAMPFKTGGAAIIGFIQYFGLLLFLTDMGEAEVMKDAFKTEVKAQKARK